MKIVVLKDYIKTIGIGDEAEGQKCENGQEVGIDSSGNFLHNSAPTINSTLLFFGVGSNKSHKEIFQAKTLWLN